MKINIEKIKGMSDHVDQCGLIDRSKLQSKRDDLFSSPKMMEQRDYRINQKKSIIAIVKFLLNMKLLTSK